MYTCVDFDGTVVDHRYPNIGQDVPHAIHILKKLEVNNSLILLTMRSGKFLDDAVNWFNHNEINLYGINHNPSQKEWTDSPKVYGDIYIDDAAIGCPLIYLEGFSRSCVDWLVVYDEILKKYNI